MSPTASSMATVRRARRGRRRRGDETRRLLLDAARSLMRAREPLTTRAITRAVGITQPAFYAHFTDVEECVRTIVEEVANRARRTHSEQRRRLLAAAPLDYAANVEHLDATLRDYEENDDCFEIIERYVGDPSELGRMIAAVFATAREELARDIWTLSEALGVPESERDTMSMMADLTIDAMASAARALREGRQTDRRRVAETIARINVSSLRAFLEAHGDPERIRNLLERGYVRLPAG